MTKPLDDDQIAGAARVLMEARQHMTALTDLPAELRPADSAQAYAVQDALHRAGGWGIGVIKVGGTSAVAQEKLGVPEPIVGVVPADAVFEAGASVALDRFHHRPMLECEFGLRLGVDVDAATDIDGDIRGLVDAVVPAIEIVDTRFEEMLGPDGPSIIADNSGSAAAVVGEPHPVAPGDDLVEARAVLSTEGEVLAEGTGRAALGNPFESLRWLLRHQRSRSRSTPAGTVVITGTCTGLTPAPVDEPVTADFGPWGRIQVTFVG